jgi:hypothetical protein
MDVEQDAQHLDCPWDDAPKKKRRPGKAETPSLRVWGWRKFPKSKPPFFAFSFYWLLVIAAVLTRVPYLSSWFRSLKTKS